jgi:hypothetical protein
MNSILKLLATVSMVAYEEDGSGGAPPATVVTPPVVTSPPAAPPAAPKAKTYSQEDMDKLLGEERRKGNEAARAAMSELEALKPKLNMTKQERDEMDARIKELNTRLMTNEEIAAQEQAKLRKAHEDTVAELTSKAEKWQRQFTDAAIERSITDAAVVHDAYNPSQVVSLLRTKTRLVPKLDSEGNATGQFEPMVQLDAPGADGEIKSLELSPGEAVKRMRDMDGSLNLFKGTGVGGLGSGNQGPPGKKDLREIAKDPEAYRKLRAEGKLFN